MIGPVQRQQLGFCCFGEDLRALLGLCRVADRTLLPQSVTGQHTCFATLAVVVTKHPHLRVSGPSFINAQELLENA